MILFAAATRLRPSEPFALEQRDVDRAAGVVQIRRAYANGESTHEDEAQQLASRPTASGTKASGIRAPQ